MKPTKGLGKKIREQASDLSMRMGTVTAVSPGPPRVVSATIGGQALTDIPVMDHVSVSVNKGCWFITMNSGKLMGIGSVDAEEFVFPLLTDDEDRHYVRGANNRTSPHLFQWGIVSTATDVNGLISVVFPEPYTSTPAVTPTRFATSSSERGLHLHAASTTGFTVRIMNAGALLASASATFHWTALGLKTNT